LPLDRRWRFVGGPLARRVSASMPMTLSHGDAAGGEPVPQPWLPCSVAGALEAFLPSWFHHRATSTEEAAKKALQSADAVCFDVDSTIIVEEGIDVLASFFGKYDEVAALTRTAMEGGVEFQDAMRQRLELLRPTAEGVRTFLDRDALTLSPGVAQLVARLHELGKDVYLVSGGFTNMIEPLAEALHIPKANIFANTILFDECGRYKDFDRLAYTSKSGGKADAVRHLKKTMGYRTMVMVGDGVTDLEARPPADAFIGYGGVQVRPKVRDGADWYVTHWREVMFVLGA